MPGCKLSSTNPLALTDELKTEPVEIGFRKLAGGKRAVVCSSASEALLCEEAWVEPTHVEGEIGAHRGRFRS